MHYDQLNTIEVAHPASKNQQRHFSESTLKSEASCKTDPPVMRLCPKFQLLETVSNLSA